MGDALAASLYARLSHTPLLLQHACYPVAFRTLLPVPAEQAQVGHLPQVLSESRQEEAEGR